jgi:hypothetical protein
MEDSYLCTVHIKNPSSSLPLRVVGDFPEVAGIDIHPRCTIEFELSVLNDLKPWIARYNNKGKPYVYLGLVDREL